MNNDPRVEAELLKIAKLLNLQPHVAPAGKHISALCADLEVHKSHNKFREKEIFFIIDSARILPPEPPQSSLKNSFLYRLLVCFFFINFYFILIFVFFRDQNLFRLVRLLFVLTHLANFSTEIQITNNTIPKSLSISRNSWINGFPEFLRN